RRTRERVVDDGEGFAPVMPVEPRRDVVDADSSIDPHRRTPNLVKRRGDEFEPTAPEHVAKLVPVEGFAPGRRDDVAHAALHRLVHVLECIARASIEDLTEHGIGRLDARAMHSSTYTRRCKA